MEWWVILLIILGFSVLYSCSINCIRFYRTSHIYKEYNLWIEGKPNRFVESSEEAISLFQKAGLKNIYITVIESFGPSGGRPINIRLFENLTKYDIHTTQITRDYFLKALGVFNRRCINCLNPLYWIEFILFLPKHLASFFNAKPESITTKIFQVVWWLLAPIAIAFRDQIYNFFSSLF